MAAWLCSLLVAGTPADSAAQPANATATKAQADKAGEALQAGRFPEAISILEDLVRQMPSDAGLHLNLGMALTMSGQPARAVPVLERALALQPDMLPGNLFLGLAHLEAGAPDKAVAPLEKVIAVDRDNGYARQGLAQAYAMLERHDLAVEQLDVLHRLEPGNPQLLAALGRGYEQVARESFEHLQQLDPDSAHVWLVVADVLMAQEKYPQAFDLLRKAEASLPGFPGIHESIAAIYAMTDHADWAEAEKAKAAAAAPDCAKLPVACAFLQGKHQDALRRTRGTTQAAALYWRIRAANELAGASFEALERLPPSLERHVVRADILRAQGQTLAAADELRRALALSPGNPEIERDLAGALFAARKVDEALPLLAKLVAQSPDDPELAVGYAEMLVQTQQMDAAIPLLQKALAARPDLVPAHSALGRALMAKGEAAAAVPHLEKALSSDEDGSLHYQLAQAYQRTGQAELATTALQKYRDMQQAAEPPADAAPAATSSITPPAP